MSEGAAVQRAEPNLSKPVRAAVRLREATFTDYAQVRDLQVRNGLTTKSYAEWTALWAENPAYLRNEGRVPLGWVLESDDGSLAGYLGNLPLEYTLKGQHLRAVTAHSWVVDPAFRGYSVLLLDTFRRQPGIDLFVFTTVNASAEAVLRAFGMRKNPVGEWDSARFWITDYRGFVSTLIASKSIPFAPAWAPPVAATLWARDRVLNWLGPSRNADTKDISIEVLTEFDESFESFWEETRQQQQDHLLAIRDQETLAWHYRSSSRKGTLWIVTACLHGRMIGYWVVDRQDHPGLGLKRLRFVDFQVLTPNEGLLRTALEWTLEHGRRTGVHVVEDLGTWLKRYRVRGTIGPYKRRMKSWLFYYWTGVPELAEQLQNPEVWTASSFDGDASL